MSLTGIKCPACEAENEPVDKYCVRCGIQINPPLERPDRAKVICPRCQRDNPSDSFFCYTCGKYFADIQVAEPATTAKPAVKPDASSVPGARLTMRGGLEIVLTGSPTYIERGDFEGKLSPDLVMCISRQHILITYEDGAYFVQDYGRNGVGSTNHTRLNGDDIYHQGRQPLRDGDRIELAYQPELTLTFRQDTDRK